MQFQMTSYNVHANPVLPSLILWLKTAFSENQAKKTILNWVQLKDLVSLEQYAANSFACRKREY